MRKLSIGVAGVVFVVGFAVVVLAARPSANLSGCDPDRVKQARANWYRVDGCDQGGHPICHERWSGERVSHCDYDPKAPTPVNARGEPLLPDGDGGWITDDPTPEPDWLIRQRRQERVAELRRQLAEAGVVCP